MLEKIVLNLFQQKVVNIENLTQVKDMKPYVLMFKLIPACI